MMRVPDIRFAVGVTIVIASLALPALATTQIDFTVEDLLRRAEQVVRATPVGKECDAQACRYVLRVIEDFAADDSGGEINLEQVIAFHGAPELVVGREYVLFLKHANRLERILGLQLGTLQIRDGSVFDYWDRPVSLINDRIRHRAGIQTHSTSHLTLDALRAELRDRSRARTR